MPVQPVMPKVQTTVNTVKTAVKEVQPHKTINSYEFHLGFIPKKNPMGHSSLKSDEQFEILVAQG